VGITRAQLSLTLTYARKRTRFGEEIDCAPSRFIEELPREHLDWPDAKPPDPEEARITGKAHLSNLKSLLS
jgi:ATP-dependent DNA helicase Rep